MVVFYLDDLEIFFPYDYIYPEQYAYMKYLKKTLDSEGHCVLEMPTGTGKTVAIFSLITSYQYYKNDDSKFIFCTRTVAEMEKSLIELKKVINYRINIIKKRNEISEQIVKTDIKEDSDMIRNEYKNEEDDNAWNRFGRNSEILAMGISARRCMCVNEKVLLKHEREKIDEECRKLTATFVREKKYISKKLNNYSNSNIDRISDFIIKNKHHIDMEDYFSIYNSKNSISEYNDLGLCGYFENYKKDFVYELIEPGVYTIEELKTLCKNYKNRENMNAPICPYFCAKKIIEIAKVIVLNYQYIIDPKVSKSIFLGKDINNRVNYKKNDIIVFDEAHNIDSVCLEALSVNIDRSILNKASMNITTLFKKIEKSRIVNEDKLREECYKILKKIKSGKEEYNSMMNRNGEQMESINSGNKQFNENKEDMFTQLSSGNGNNDDNLESQNKKNQQDEIYFDEEMNLVFRGLLGEEPNNREGDDVEKLTDKVIIDDLKKILNIDSSDNVIKDKDKDKSNLEEINYSPLLMEDIIKNVVMPGNIRKSEHFLNLMRIVVVYLKKYINIYEVTSEGPLSFLYKCEKDTKLDTSFFKYSFDRLKSLLNALQVVDTDDYSALNVVCNFCTLIGNYFKGFIIICEPYPEATGIYDPVIQFACLDSSIAMKSVLNRYKSVVLTSGTITPLELYPKLLNFSTVLTASFPMSFDRNCVCPLIVTKSSDLIPLSSQYSLRNDLNVIKNYGFLLVEMCKNIPDGIISYFPSYIYMEHVMSTWYELGIISNILEYKLIFIETKDIVSTTIALHNFKKACDLGKGAVFLSICRGKIAEGIDFDKHYGKCVILFGIPYQYTLSRILKARLDFLKETYNIQENEFLTFDAMRQASQCVGRIIRNKKDYGIMIFSDIRYARNDKKGKLPPWIIKCMDVSNINLTIGAGVSISKKFLLNMSQEYKETDQTKISQVILQNPSKCWDIVKSVLNMDDFI
ncbi:TFIIH basal transcription factor complex helicase XPD subunit, putative [Plasmodium chabaudi chabaudi]|uniref:DNA 5'-3' helicase n=1 Tax=Plasmodium chabaudi chabaudi TaxID=31271 RepID=A0A4V0K7V1_PLACU|nr:TFIIH basal transcription factor complex helicase XPD subunit, putative [Plasmodium chabaudi chabaudi]VTZ68562.1 TFIIH basal transcription factor complex helicase XPD subunit, putative [Plasmodium chabaudi chabaudi]|eukprot:XP_016653876.1 DNA excision-repair helicase, putative [Plasmodium chabaudi chabaudi]